MRQRVILAGELVDRNLESLRRALAHNCLHDQATLLVYLGVVTVDAGPRQLRSGGRILACRLEVQAILTDWAALDPSGVYLCSMSAKVNFRPTKGGMVGPPFKPRRPALKSNAPNG